MFRYSLAAMALGTLGLMAGGCASGTTSADTQQLGPTQLAAFSARAQYPDTQPTNNLQTAALVNHDKDEIKIYNFSDQPIGQCKIWINRSFVYPLHGIAPHSHVTVATKDVYDSMGNSLSKRKADVTDVQIETDNGFFNLEGPAME